MSAAGNEDPGPDPWGQGQGLDFDMAASGRSRMAVSAEQKLIELGLALPGLTKPRFNYVPFRRTGDKAFISGQVPRLADGTVLAGKVGSDKTTEQGREAARLCALHILAVARSITGSLDDIEMLKLFGMVNAAPDFQEQPHVIDACSALLLEVLGERGQHARSAVGVGSLPSNVMVEIEAVVRVVA
jgi:enamine deaminase RidA (YjgF/YER057c/UK114 family)